MDVYYIGFFTQEGVHVCVVNETQQISMITVNPADLNNWFKTNFANGEMLGYTANNQKWYLCASPNQQEMLSNFALFQQSHNAGIVNLDQRIKIFSATETLRNFN